MRVFQWEQRVQSWVARHSIPEMRSLTTLNILWADEGIMLLALPFFLWWTSLATGLSLGLALLATSTKIDDYLKNWFHRGRPRDAMEWGFPSGDCILVTVWSVPLLGWWAILPISIVAWARVARGAHWPLDTLGGTMVGLWLVLPGLLGR